MKKIILIKKLTGVLGLLLMSLVCFSQTVDVSRQSNSILNATRDFLVAIASSDVHVDSITLDDTSLMKNNNALTKDIEIYKTTVANSGSSLNNALSITDSEKKDCNSCDVNNNQEKLNRIKSVISGIREDRDGFLSAFSGFVDSMNTRGQSISRATIPSDGPNCSWWFYVCLAAASGASSGLAAAAAIWLCACEFCELKPPRCP